MVTQPIPSTIGRQRAPPRPRRRDLFVFVVNGFRVSILKPALPGWLVRVGNGP
jgi:hypothetical protein